MNDRALGDSRQFEVDWLLDNALVTAVVAGPRNLEQWMRYLSAIDHTFERAPTRAEA